MSRTAGPSGVASALDAGRDASMAKLAVDGGEPVRPLLLPYGHQTVDQDDIDAVTAALQSDFLTTGPQVAKFEEAFAAEVGSTHAVAVSSGTAALHAAVFAAGIGAGDEVITTPMTFAASANCVRYQGGTVRFADVRRDTLTIDAQRVRDAIGPRTRGIIAVDYAGQPADLEDIQSIAAGRGIVVVEDAAHALGATYKARKIGSISTLTTFSLHPVKQITTGEGGMVTTNDEALAERVRRFRNHGIVDDYRRRAAAATWFYEMEDLGNNYRLTDFQSALGLSQLRKLSSWVARRRALAARYDAALGDIAEIELPQVQSDRESAWHLYVIRLHLDRLRVGRAQFFAALRAENIGVNVHYIPVPWHPYYQKLGCRRGQWPAAESEYERLLSLPLWPGMTDQDLDDTVAGVRKVVAAYRV
jgi:perosamine synthetase